MRRIALIGSLLALAGAGAAAVAQGQSSTRPPVRAHLAACETGPAATDRFAVFTGSMPTDTGVAAMAMRFNLYERQPGSGFVRVSLPNWGVWEKTTKRNAPGFIFTKRVEQLAAPAAFRAVVSFRWYDAKGKLLRSAKRTSEPCTQPDQRPDLHVKRVIFPSGKGLTEIIVRNRGLSAAGPFDVGASRTSGDAQIAAGTSVSGLLAGEQTTVALRLGRCKPGDAVIVTLDKAGQVDEVHEDDNVVTVPCPS